MSASAIFILDSKGKVLIYRNYRDDVDLSIIDKFLSIVIAREDEGQPSPVIHYEGSSFFYVKYNYLYLVALTKRNANAAIVFAFLYRLINIFLEYFKDLEEESIQDNFVITYELLDEIMDFGYPQTTDPKILQEYITQQSSKLEIVPRPPMAVTNAVSWRSESVKYRRNEVFLDVVESVNVLVSSTGNVLQSEIVGCIKMKVYLSGMPELRLGVNDKLRLEPNGIVSSDRGKGKFVELEDIKFHQCVRLSRFENDRTISFIPPDGEFELMSYRLNTHVSGGVDVRGIVWDRYSRIGLSVTTWISSKHCFFMGFLGKEGVFGVVCHCLLHPLHTRPRQFPPPGHNVIG